MTNTASPSIAQIASEVATVDEVFLKAAPFLSAVMGFIPGAQVAVPLMPLFIGVLTALDNAARDVAAGNTDGAFKDIFTQIQNHLTAGAPNSPILSGPLPAAS